MVTLIAPKTPQLVVYRAPLPPLCEVRPNSPRAVQIPQHNSSDRLLLHQLARGFVQNLIILHPRTNLALHLVRILAPILVALKGKGLAERTAPRPLPWVVWIQV
jgi:hypothetical protein